MAELKDKLQAAFDKFSALDEKTKAAIEEKIKQRTNLAKIRKKTEF